MKTAVVAAMRPELDELVSRLVDRMTVKRAGFEFHEGRLEGHEVVLLLSGIGKVNAAVGTALLIEDYQPDAVINTGVAGGFDQQLRPGDMVLSTKVIHHDVDATPFGYRKGQVAGMPKSYIADAQLLSIAESITGDGTETMVRSGLLVSGDVFIHEPEAAGKIVTEFPGVLAGELEAAAVAQTCYLFGIPFLIARSISDVIGSGGNKVEYEQFLPLAAARSVKFVIEMIKSLEEAS
jgi:adenosylhomocysteine nucleosidase